MNSLHIIDYLIICIVPIFFLAMGFIHRKKVKTFSDFFLLGRRLKTREYIYTFLATNISAATVIIALSYQSFTIGISTIWLAIWWVLGIFFFMILVNKKNKLSLFFKKGYTLHEFLDKPTFNSINLRRITAWITIITFIATIGIEIFAGILIFQRLLLPSLSSLTIAILLALIIVAYTVLSGFVGAVKTDIFQSIVITICFGILAYTCIQNIPLIGKNEFLNLLLPAKGKLEGIFYAGTEWITAAFFLMFFFNIAVSDMWQRCCAIKGNIKKINIGLIVTGILFIPFWTVPILMGVISKGAGLSKEPFYAGLDFFKLLETPLIGLAVMGLFAAIMSTSDSLLIAASSIFMYDIHATKNNIEIDKLSPEGQRRILIASRMWVLVFGIISIIVAVFAIWLSLTLYDLIVLAFSAQIVLAVPLLFGIFLRKENAQKKAISAKVSVIGGFIAVLIVAVYGIIFQDEKIRNSAPIIGLILSFFLFMVFFKKSPKLSKK